jgi:Fic family protein
MDLQIIPHNLLKKYKRNNNLSVLAERFNKLHDSELSKDSFSFYTSVSAVFSSKIEGENIDLDSFVKHKWGTAYQPDYTRKIDDLYDAYLFAQQNRLDSQSVSYVHALLTKHILWEEAQGVFRKANMFVVSNDGKIEYVAALPQQVASEMEKFYTDIQTLLSAQLSVDEEFYFASLLHLVFIKIHPFADGNGRTARLLEKWYLSQKLGEKAWFIQSERFYYEQHPIYYANIRRIGIEYLDLNYAEALPFLQMLPDSLSLSNN